MSIKTLKFSVDSWAHLYSLTLAVQKNSRNSGRSLSISGCFQHADFSDAGESDICIKFVHVDESPGYKIDENQLVFAELEKNKNVFSAEIMVAESVFLELKRNLIEYADIEGIHMIFNLKIFLSEDNPAMKIIDLEYAMKGDR